MKETHQLMLANMAWSAEQHQLYPEFFTQQLKGQKPACLWIGCSDSRVAPDQITQSPPGGLFIHRNIANLVHGTDLNLMSVVEYAVNALGVSEVIVCGHYGCGGIIGTLDAKVHGTTGQWLEEADRVYKAHAAEIDGIADREARINRFVELNVRDQLINLARSPTIEAAFAARKPVHLHGWVYDLRDGLLKSLMQIDADTQLDALGTPAKVL